MNPTAVNASDSIPQDPSVPMRTVSEGVRRLVPGDTLRIAPGTYRESIVLPRRNWTSAQATVIEALPGGEVLIKGSRVLTGWRSVGAGVLALQLATQPQQVFVKGVALTQIGGTIFGGYPENPRHELAGLHSSQGGIWPGRKLSVDGSLPAESFTYQAATGTLLVRSAQAEETGANIEVSTAGFLLVGDELSDLVVRGLSFEHASSTTDSRRGAVTVTGNRLAFDNIRVRNVDGKCISVWGDDTRIENSRFERCGQLGIWASGRRVLVSGNTVRGSNTRGFNKWWEAGGMKFVGDGGLRSSIVRSNVVIGNQGDGIWFDWGNDQNLVSRNVAAYNSGFGIHYEVSSFATIADNITHGNGQRGIYVVDSHDVTVVHNLATFNGLEGIAIVKERAATSAGTLDLRPLRIVTMGNVLGWNKGTALTLPGVAYTPQSDLNALIDRRAVPPRLSMGWPTTGNDRRLLADWTATFGLDRQSRSYAIEPPVAVPTAGLSAADAPQPTLWPAGRAWMPGFVITQTLPAAPTGDGVTAFSPGPRP